MNLQLLTQCDRVLTGCGRPVMPAGVGWVDIPYGIQYQQFIPGQTLTPGSSPINTSEKVVNTPVPFMLKSIQGFAQPATNGTVYWRLRLPNGRFLQARNCAVTPSFDFGSYRLSFADNPIECPPGSKFFITTDGITANANQATGLTVLFEGVLRYPIKGNPCGAPSVLDDCRVERYTLNPNQNILAPEWRLGDQCYPETPPGYRDDFFQYCTPFQNLVAVPWTGAAVSNVQFPIIAEDFVGRLTFINKIVSTTGTITAGQLAVRVRTDSGYELTDGFTLATPVERSLFPSFPLRAGGALYIDYMVVDGAGTPNSVYNVQTILAGVRRRRAA